MVASREFLDYVLEQMALFGVARARRMFGGAGIYRDGVMFALIADDVLYLKATPSNSADFDAEGLEPFNYAAAGGKRTVMSYRRALARCLEDPHAMAEWCRKAWAAASEGSRKRRLKPPERVRRNRSR